MPRPITPGRHRRRGTAATIWAGVIACMVGSCGTAGADPGPTPPPPPGPGGFGSGWAKCGDQLVPADSRVDMRNPLGGLIYRELLRHMCQPAQPDAALPPHPGRPPAIA
ncbi:hypothetical protein MTER_17110 [Mycolicibacter terrae]|jgi:hypothetical protein|uniref:Lipoprotein n=1 Tax=Mycolicibacter terrae TaxID=1788 RepID=A0AAD1MHI8_9MYCO|nr:hypothetical protein MTER_17110 [Mycolicibacter terrae]